MHNLQPEYQNCYRIPRQGDMQVDGRIYLKEDMLQDLEYESIKQLMDAASLPGVYKYVIGMPDIHTGFGLPIGGVMAMDAEEGLVSAGAVGMDINCGVRLLNTGIPANEATPQFLQKLMESIAKHVPSGVGKKSRHAKFSGKKFSRILTEGVPAMLEMGLGRPEDQEYIEERGSFPGADPAAMSKEAKARGDQLSTLGGGNHFIEIGYTAEFFEPETAMKMGLRQGNLIILIHTGSRGLGHQICSDYSKSMKKIAQKNKLHMPTAGLASVPIQSPEGQNYLSAMACAVNFAFCNRQWITHDIRQAFADIMGNREAQQNLNLVYDVAHNIAKFEKIDGKKLLIHRKGATRALPPHHPLNPPKYRSTGHPALIPGSMGTASYLVTGTKKVAETFHSVNHGAGRILSRKAAKKEIPLDEMQESMKGIILLTRNYNAVLDEAPQAYKNIDQVVDTLAETDLIRKVARFYPLAVIKGD